MKRTVIRLADGRRLTYFDERDDAVRDQVDRRQLPPPPPASRLHYDPLTDEWVTIAAHRQDRTFLPAPDDCPLCPSTPERATEIPAYDYDVVAFDNRFPAFSPHAGAVPAGTGNPYTPLAPGHGRCEVVCFTDRHEGSFVDLSPARVRTVVDVLADRTAELSGEPGVQQVYPFENRGVEIGATLHHPHGQIYAYPFVTPRTRALLAASYRHAKAYDGANLYADVLAAERAHGTRVVGANEHWTAYVPPAARWPYEVHLAPHRHVPDLPALDDPERDAFGPLYLDVLRRLDSLFGVPMPYVAAWHQAPVRDGRHLAYLHLQLFSVRRAPGKLKYLAGAESGMGTFLNDVSPDETARLLRAATPETVTSPG